MDDLDDGPFLQSPPFVDLLIAEPLPQLAPAPAFSPAPSNPQMDQIDLELSKHEFAARELRSRRNTHAPISKLPAELLCNIFMFCSLLSTFSNSNPAVLSYGSSGSRWHWISVSHVCHHWRNAALSCPALWSRPEFTRTEWAYEMIARSKQAPLTIEVSSQSLLTPRAVDAVNEGLKQLKRIEEIRISASRDNMLKLLAPLSSLSDSLAPNPSPSSSSFETISPAPILHTLLLDASHRSFYSASISEPYVFLPELLSSGVPSLRHLEIIQCRLSWESALFQNLTFLKVINRGQPGPTKEQFLCILAQMPELKHLELEGVLPSSAGEGLHMDTDIISLPYLRKLRATGNIDECAFLLARTRIPNTASVNLTAKCTEAPKRDSNAFRYISEVCQRLPLAHAQVQLQEQEPQQLNDTTIPSPIKRLVVESLGLGPGIQIEAWCGPLRGIPPSPLPQNITLKISWPSSAQSHHHHIPDLTATDISTQVVLAVCAALPLEELSELHVNLSRANLDTSTRNREDPSLGSVSPAHTLANMFGALPRISCLTVQGNSAYGFIDVLGSTASNAAVENLPEFIEGSSKSSSSLTLDGRRNAHSPSITFPALRRLRLIAVDFKRFAERSDPLWWLSDDDFQGQRTSSVPPTHPLSTVSEFRIEHNVPLHCIVLQECAHLTAMTVERLREIVGVPGSDDDVQGVYWDRMEFGYSDDEDDDEDEDDDMDMDMDMDIDYADVYGYDDDLFWG